MFDFNLKSRQPIYEQLVEKFKQLMIAGVLAPHEKLPSVRQLSTQLSVNPNTIQKAYRELEHQSFTYSIPGKGSFVSPISDTDNSHKLKEIKDNIKQLLEEAIFLGMTQDECKKLVKELFDNTEEE